MGGADDDDISICECGVLEQVVRNNNSDDAIVVISVSEESKVENNSRISPARAWPGLVTGICLGNDGDGSSDFESRSHGHCTYIYQLKNSCMLSRLARSFTPSLSPSPRFRLRLYTTMPVPFNKLRDEAELAILSVLRGCYL
jgi:hypothetical protein